MIPVWGSIYFTVYRPNHGGSLVSSTGNPLRTGSLRGQPAPTTPRPSDFMADPASTHDLGPSSRTRNADVQEPDRALRSTVPGSRF